MSDVPDDSLPRRLNALLGEFRDRLRAIVRQRCPAHLGIDPDDVEQEIRIRLWRALERESGIEHPASYLYRTALAVIVDMIRRRDARPDLSMAEELDVADGDVGVHATASDPMARAQGEAFARAVVAAVAELPERRRRPVQLHLQGFSTAQVGTLLGISEPTARNLVYRGLEAIRSRLANEGWNDE